MHFFAANACVKSKQAINIPPSIQQQFLTMQKKNKDFIF
jgi:hypothetical protein